jgi:mannobiose 2-epimerase
MGLPAMLSIPLLLSLSAMVLAQAVGPTRENYLRIAAEVEASLRNDDLNKLFPAAVDPQGGFFENFAEDWSHRGGSRGDSTRSVVYQSRLTWLAAQAAMRYPAQAKTFLSYARHGVRFLAERQWDKVNGGFWWSVRVDGGVVRANDKHIYGNAFAIYALAAAYKATRDPADLQLAQKAFQWLETHAHDPIHGGYFEQLRGDGSHVASTAARPEIHERAHPHSGGAHRPAGSLAR